MPRRERPLEGGDGPVLRFAADLRALRRAAGNPTYQELADRAHYSVSALSQAAAGRRLPSLAVASAYVRACDGDVEAWERRWHDVTAELASTTDGVADHGDQRPPYLGLAAFQPEDTDRFFGRERLVDELATRLARGRFVAVFGASGAGKSSLLRAGLIPRLKGTVVLFTPGPRPVEECALHLAPIVGAASGRLQDELIADSRALHRAVRQAGVEPVLVVDQFEEIFTLCRDVAERVRFIDLLLTAAMTENSGCRVVLGVRSDFYTHCMAHPALVDALRDAQLAVGPMTSEQLRRAITQPAIDAGYTVEGALLVALVGCAAGQPAVLPLVSHVLLETWHRRQGMTLTLRGFQAAGGIKGALAQTAESCFAEFSDTQRTRARDLFVRLTALGEGTEDTKRKLAYGELDEHPDTTVVLDRLADARLLTLDDGGIEVTHEALIRCWPRLSGWLTEDRDGLRLHRQLTEAAETWAQLDRDPGAVYRGARLALTRDWVDTSGAVLSLRERDFLQASVATQEREQAVARRRVRRLRQLVVLLAILLAVTGVTVVNQVRAEEAATDARDVAVAQKVAGQATNLYPTEPALAAQLGLAAYRLDQNPATRGSLLSLSAFPYASQLVGHTSNVNAVAFSPDGRTAATASRDRTVKLWDVGDPHRPMEQATLTGHADNVNAVVFSPGRHLLATGGWDHSVILWDVSDTHHPRRLSVLAGHSDYVNAVAISPDGRVLASASTDRTVRLWDISDPTAPRELPPLLGHTDSVVSVAFAADGHTIVTAGWDRTARLWDVTDPRHPMPLAVLTGHQGPVTWAVFSPDGRTVATASQDHTVKLWNVSQPSRPTQMAVLTGHSDVVRAVAFSPDDHTVATASQDHTVKLWNVSQPNDPSVLSTLEGHIGAVVSVVFSPDGRTLATASDDHTARLWDLPSPTITAHANTICDVAFSPDGRQLASSSWDHTVKLWDPADPRHAVTLTGHRDSVCGAAFSPDGHLLATACYDHTAKLWSIDQRSTVATLNVDTNNVNSVAFSPNGRMLAVASLDHQVRLWDVGTAGRPVVLADLVGHTDGINSVAFSPDGKLLATASWDRTVRLWDVTDPRAPQGLATLTGHTDGVASVAFSPDGRILVTGSYDRSVMLWAVGDPRQPRPLSTLTGHTDSVYMVAFSPRGDVLATASGDHTVKLWAVDDPSRPQELATLTGHTDGVNAVAFSPDGHTVASGGVDHSLRLWDSDPERVAAHICAVAYPRITPEEWDHYFTGMPFQPPCPS